MLIFMNRQHLKEMAGSGDFESAFQALLGYGKSQGDKAWYNAVLVQYNNFKALEQQQLMATLSNEETGLARNRVLSGLLSLIDTLPGEGDGMPQQPGAPEQSRAGKLRWAPWLAAAALLIIIAVVFARLGGSEKPSDGSTTATAEPAPAGESLAVGFPKGDAIVFTASTGDEVSYRFLNGQLKDTGGGARQLSFTARCQARKGYGVNFWDDSFRLELDGNGLFLAPSSDLNEVVENNSYKDGVLSFELKEPFSSLSLLISNPWDRNDIRKLPLEVIK